MSRRYAVEVSDVARDAMEGAYPGLIRSVQYPEQLPDKSIDLLFSTSAIEHVECPLTEMRELARKVKKGGRAVRHSLSFIRQSWLLATFAVFFFLRCSSRGPPLTLDVSVF